MSPMGRNPSFDDRPRRRRFSISDVEQMAGLGMFRTVDRIDLIAGEVYVTAMPSDEHAAVVMRLQRFFRQHLAEAVHWRIGQPLRIAEGFSCPDLAVLPGEESDYQKHPSARIAMLVIEVAGRSISEDEGLRLAAYASAGVGEYWVVDVNQHSVAVHADPTTDRFLKRTVYLEGDTIASVPGATASLPVHALFA